MYIFLFVRVWRESLLSELPVLLQLIIIDLHPHPPHLLQSQIEAHEQTPVHVHTFTSFFFLTDFRGGLRGLLHVRVCVSASDSSPIVTLLHTYTQWLSAPMHGWLVAWLAGAFLACHFCLRQDACPCNNITALDILVISWMAGSWCYRLI